MRPTLAHPARARDAARRLRHRARPARRHARRRRPARGRAARRSRVGGGEPRARHRVLPARPLPGGARRPGDGGANRPEGRRDVAVPGHDRGSAGRPAGGAPRVCVVSAARPHESRAGAAPGAARRPGAPRAGRGGQGGGADGEGHRGGAGVAAHGGSAADAVQRQRQHAATARAGLRRAAHHRPRTRRRSSPSWSVGNCRRCSTSWRSRRAARRARRATCARGGSCARAGWSRARCSSCPAHSSAWMRRWWTCRRPASSGTSQRADEMMQLFDLEKKARPRPVPRAGGHAHDGRAQCDRAATDAVAARLPGVQPRARGGGRRPLR